MTIRICSCKRRKLSNLYVIIYLLKSFYVKNKSYHIPETITCVDVANMFVWKCHIFFGAASPCFWGSLTPHSSNYLFVAALQEWQVVSGMEAEEIIESLANYIWFSRVPNVDCISHLLLIARRAPVDWWHHKIFNNYSPKWRWIVVDIYRVAKRRGKYPPLSPTLRWIIVLVYTTQAE